MGLVWSGNRVHHKVRKLCEKLKPESCPDCGSKELTLVYEKFSREGSWVRKAYWLCDNCARIIHVYEATD